MKKTQDLRRQLLVDLLTELEPEYSTGIRAFVDACADEKLEPHDFGSRLAHDVGLPRSEIARVQAEIDRLVATVSEPSSASAVPRLAGRSDELTPGGARYTDFRTVAQGGMGVVRAARDAWLGRAVAVKTTQRRGPASGRQLLREARLTGSLEHPGVVPVHDLGVTEDGEPYYVMRYVEGGRTLLDAINDCATLDDRIALLEPFLQVCDTMRYAHSRGVLHYDLKPANVVLGQFGEVLVVDWGLAVELGEARDGLRPSAGTPGYMAPEVARGETRAPTASADVYSLGATLHHVLTGAPPLDVSTLAELRDRLVRLGAGAPVEFPIDIPGALAAICGRAITTSPADRHASVDELATDVRKWLRARAVDREFEQHLLLAEASLADAEDAEAVARSRPLDRAAAACERAAALRPADARATDAHERIARLRARTTFSLARVERRRVLRIAGLTLGGLLLLTAVVTTVVVIRARDREAVQRTRADGLSRFMLTDLHERLAPLGRLDLLKGVAEKALASLRADALTDPSPDQVLAEATALRQIADVLRRSAETERALEVYQRSLELCRLHESTSQPAQSHVIDTLIEISLVEYDLGRRSDAATHVEEAQRLAVSSAPGRSRRRQRARAAAMLGALDSSSGRPTEAAEHLREALGALSQERTISRVWEEVDRLELHVRRRLGDVLASLGQVAESEALLEQAVSLGESRPRAAGLDVRWMEELAHSRASLSDLLKTRGGDDDRALDLAQQGLESLLDLVQRDPDNALRWSYAARGYTRVARLLEGRGDDHGSLEQWRLAQRVLDDLVAADTAQKAWAADLASVEVQLARVSLRAQRGEDSAQWARSAAQRYRALVGADPESMKWRAGLGAALVQVTRAARECGRPERAEAWMQDSVATLTKLVARHPDEPSIRSALASVEIERARVRFVQSEPEAASKAAARAQTHLRHLLARDPMHRGWRAELAFALTIHFRIEEFRENVETAHELLEEATARYDELVAETEDGTAPEVLARAARAHTELALMLWSHGQESSLAQHFQRASKLWELALHDETRRKSFLPRYAEFLGKRALSEQGRGAIDAARATHSEAITTLRELRDEEPDDFGRNRSLADALAFAAHLELRVHARDAVLALYEECGAVHDRMVERAPENADVLEQAAYARAKWSIGLRRVLRLEDSLRVAEEALDLQRRAGALEPGRRPRQGWYEDMVESGALLAGRRPPETAAELSLLARHLFQRNEYETALRHFELAFVDDAERRDLRWDALRHAAATAAQLSTQAAPARSAVLLQRSLTWIEEYVELQRGAIADAQAAAEQGSGGLRDAGDVDREVDARAALTIVRESEGLLDPIRSHPRFEALFRRSDERR